MFVWILFRLYIFILSSQWQFNSFVQFRYVTLYIADNFHPNRSPYLRNDYNVICFINTLYNWSQRLTAKMGTRVTAAFRRVRSLSSLNFSGKSDGQRKTAPRARTLVRLPGALPASRHFHSSGLLAACTVQPSIDLSTHVAYGVRTL